MASQEASRILLSAGLPPDRVLVPSNPDFVERQSSYWSCTVRSLQPACIVQPQSAEEVSSVLRALTAERVSFAVRSGGHTAWAGANSIGSGGVTIDLGRLDHVRVGNGADETGGTVDLGPGNRWGKVYADLAEHGLTVAGGREGNVGVAGLILGGGMAFFTARHGLACDNVVEFEVVLADGKIVKARESGEHADLYRALKGGGNNFGIVTNFKMRSIAARPVWAGMTVHPKEAIPQAVQALKDYTDAPGFKDVKVVGALIHMAGAEESPSYKKWLEMPLTATTCKMTTVPQLAMDYSQAKDYHNVWFTATFKNDTRIVAKAAELHDTLVSDLKSFITDGDFITQCLFQPFPRLFGQRSAAAGGNMLGIDRQPDNGLLWLAVAQVRTAEQERFAYLKIKEWVQAVKAFAASIDGNLEWTYLNYADKSQDPLGSYGVENMRRMQEVAHKYDPNGVFQKLCPGGFKLSNVRLPN
ncbi:hypothetical protein B0I37DRAFT_395565 [Chaetomium sp. MPI-CAGE-AT-0009]|nr:hypothetical protein B0I37DRAFT_395565 [Chaetomium sp. MPI-CAGE-AT-0009]